MFVKKNLHHSAFFFIFVKKMDTITLIKERYGEKAVPHKRETPFGFNHLMSTYLANGVIGTGFFMLLFWGGMLIYFLKCFNLI